jgi:hypothetical protein
MAKKKKDKHETEVIDKIDHVPVATYDDGQCLSPHRSTYNEKDSCSYRWQGVGKAEENSHIYNAHRGFKPRPAKSYHLGEHSEAGFAESSLDAGFGGKIAARLSTFTREKFSKKLGKKVKVPMQTVSALNFTNGQVPYPNEVHHVLPTAELKKGLDSKVKDARTIQLVCNSLLKEKYNLNHKDNMIILALGKKHAYEIGLPSHPDHHPGYSKQLEGMINSALANVQKAKDDGQSHDELDYQKIKDNLETISNEMYAALAKPGVMPRQGIYKYGTALDTFTDFPKIVFA